MPRAPTSDAIGVVTMLRVRVLASSSTLFTGEHKVISTSISVKPELALFNGNGHTSRWNAGTTHFINSFSKTSIVVKLMTEKLEPFMKNDPARKASSGTCLPAESSPYLKSNRLKQEGISASGKISNAFVKNVPTQLESCDVLESPESSTTATSVGGTMVTGIHLPIRSMHASETVTIRISNISTKTADAMIHSICKSVGPLEGLLRKKESEVEAFFIVKNNLDPQSILEQLDCKIVDKCQWSACVSTEDSGSAPMTTKDNSQCKLDDRQCKLGDQMSSSIADVKRQILREFLTKKLYLEDLENLHVSLVHLENYPNKFGKSSKN
ncbi:uncharacterized protein LOC117917687 isoform X3 [Vitis riparia]|uniref:uncharacterized protein LOC117917687 isoform X3 n=1 Tax=Vitis riparia TaxID=96939 RepID=UPI00155A6A5F|nr:uncharacterized protein LOC117917687 isoform X3 [Vitis riparia]